MINPADGFLVRLIRDLDDPHDLAWAPTGEAIVALADRTDPGGTGDSTSFPVIIDVTEFTKPS